MKLNIKWPALLLILTLASCKSDKKEAINPHYGQENTSSELDTTTLTYPSEKHITNVRQLTFGGDNAEAYWSF